MLRKNLVSFILFLNFFIFGFITNLSGQCMLANPSFEVTGSENNFTGWEQFGITNSSSDALQGSYAAEVMGTNNGSWDVSAYWQTLDCAVGEQWGVSGFVKSLSSSPFIGDCIAIVNVEWRDSSNNLISYDSFTVADNNTPLDEYTNFSVTSSPAPEGTFSTHLLVGVLQSPYNPPPKVLFDQITFYSTTSPTIDEMQWDDFPDGRSIEFAGGTWKVKGTGWFGPGPNNFSHLPESVWIDDEEQIHLTIKNIGNIWYSTEVVLEEILGYGDYIFTTRGSFDQLDINAVLGFFTWQYGPCWDPNNLWFNPYNEIDVEISRWGDAGNEIGQFVAQPWDYEGNMSRFDFNIDSNELTSYAFRWLPDRIEFRSWAGDSQDEAPVNMIHEWVYTGPHTPRPEQPRVHMNLWQFSGSPTSDQEVIINNFTFIPIGSEYQIVENLTLNIEASNIILQWDVVPDAMQYYIYESLSPQGPWIRITTCDTASCTILLAGNKKFYNVSWE